MVLDRNPKNYFAEVEQIAFCPAHMPPGIEASPDKMLQGRLFSYSDTHRHRLGANYHQIPVNAPKCPYANYQRDGPMCLDGNQGKLLKNSILELYNQVAWQSHWPELFIYAFLWEIMTYLSQAIELQLQLSFV